MFLLCQKRTRQAAESSIDVYAVQCGDCHKWRVVETQEEFEEIRSKIIEDPFVCSRKAGTTCEDAADIDYDSTRTWVIDRPNLPKPPKGFKRSLILRKDYSKMDVYYITPQGKKLRTRNEVAAFVKANPEYADVSPASFYFATPKIMENTIPQNLAKGSPASSGLKKSSRNS